MILTNVTQIRVFLENIGHRFNVFNKMDDTLVPSLLNIKIN